MFGTCLSKRLDTTINISTRKRKQTTQFHSEQRWEIILRLEEPPPPPQPPLPPPSRVKYPKHSIHLGSQGLIPLASTNTGRRTQTNTSLPHPPLSPHPPPTPTLHTHLANSSVTDIGPHGGTHRSLPHQNLRQTLLKTPS